MPTGETITTLTRYPELRELIESGVVSPEDATKIGKLAKFAVSFGSTELPDLSQSLKDRVTNADTASRYEAEQSGDLVYYHAGDVDPLTRVAFSACFWTSRRAAALALHGPVHTKEAIPLAKSGLVYEHYAVNFHDIAEDEEFGFLATPYDDIHTIEITREN